MSIANEIRAEFDRIIKRNFGLPNALGAVRIETAEKVIAYIDQAEANVCTCEKLRGFEIPIRHSAGVASLEQARIDRLTEDDERAAEVLGAL